MSSNKKLRIALICGGPSNEREVSLKSGTQIARSLEPQKYAVSLIEISKDGKWLLSQSTEKSKKPGKAIAIFSKDTSITRSNLRKIDVAFIALHGYFGEDGKIQSMLELLKIPYTGSGVMASAIAMNKAKTMDIAALAGIKVPPFVLLNKSIRIKRELVKFLGYPLVIKPNESGSSVGITIAHDEKELEQSLRKAFQEGAEVIAQKYVEGRELTCGVMGNTGRTDLLALPPVEIVTNNKFFDYEAKYSSGKSEEICPAHVSKNIERAVQNLSKKIHALLGCDGLTRSDFILDKKGNLNFLEINTIPGMTEASLAPKEAKAIGWSFDKFLDKIIELAIQKHKF